MCERNHVSVIKYRYKWQWHTCLPITHRTDTHTPRAQYTDVLQFRLRFSKHQCNAQRHKQFPGMDWQEIFDALKNHMPDMWLLLRLKHVCDNMERFLKRLNVSVSYVGLRLSTQESTANRIKEPANKEKRPNETYETTISEDGGYPQADNSSAFSPLLQNDYDVSWNWKLESTIGSDVVTMLT